MVSMCAWLQTTFYVFLLIAAEASALLWALVSISALCSFVLSSGHFFGAATFRIFYANAALQR